MSTNETAELKRALRAARLVIEALDKDLTNLGKGRNLSNVPGFEGEDFLPVLKNLGSEEPAQAQESPEPDKLTSFIDDYCDGLRDLLKSNLKHFHSDWNGAHIRALAQIIVEDNTPLVKRARRALKSSQAYLAMSL